MIDPKFIPDTAEEKQYQFTEPVNIDIKPNSWCEGNIPIIDFGFTHKFLFKHADEDVINDCMTYRLLAKKAGWPHITPPIWRARMLGENGTIQVYYEDEKNIGVKIRQEITDSLKRANPNDFVRIAMLDHLTAASDRHGNNLIVSPQGTVHAIDNSHLMGKDRFSIALGTFYTPYKERICYSYLVQGGKIGKSFPPTFKKLLCDLVDGKWLVPHNAEFVKRLRHRAFMMLADGFESEQLRS